MKKTNRTFLNKIDSVFFNVYMSVVFFHIIHNSIFVHIHDFTWTGEYVDVDD